jgi:hypothetical protein
MGARQAVVASLKAVLDAYQTANPTLLRRVYPSFPGGFSGELPAAYVGERREDINHTAGLRDRRFRPTVVIVDAYHWDQPTSDDLLDQITDGLVDAYTAATYTKVQVDGVDRGIVVQSGVRETEIEASGPNGTNVNYRAVVLNFDETTITEPRA